MRRSVPQTVQLTWDALPARWIRSPFNYVGGKYRLLPSLFAHFPSDIRVFYDAFAGGGTVGINARAAEVVFIDRIPALVECMQVMQMLGPTAFVDRVTAVIRRYGLSYSAETGYAGLTDPGTHDLSAVNRAAYLRLRRAYNRQLPADPVERAAWFFTLVVYSFNNQIRYNSQGAFNMPVGKSDFNADLRARLVLFIDQLRYRPVRWHCGSYHDILRWPLAPQDFVYCDPPYWLTTAAYNAEWTAADDAELRAFCDALHARGIRFALSNVLTHHGRTHTALAAWAQKYRVIPIAADYSNASYHHSAASQLPSEEVLITNVPAPSAPPTSAAR